MDIIKSILDTDLYKLTMQYAVLRKFPDAKVKYRLIFRRSPEMPRVMTTDLWNSLHSLSENAILTNKEYKWMEENLPYLPKWYLDFIGGYRFDPDREVVIGWRANTITVDITGYWYRTILWEVPIMAILSELNFKFHSIEHWDPYTTIGNTQEKAIMFKEKGLKVVEAGTRRRYSYENQDLVIQNLKQWGGDSFLGTSNVHFAMKYDLKAFGSVAHEWYSAHGAEYGYTREINTETKVTINCPANVKAVSNWKSVYGRELDVGLPDTFTSKTFFKDLNYLMGNRTLRQDSGDPIEWGNTYLDRCRRVVAVPRGTHIIFSDSLNKEKIIEIDEAFKDKLDYSFLIGTWLTNDVPGVTPLNMVIKIVEFNGKPCVKLGDGVGKEVGDADEILRVKKELGIL